MSRIFDIQTGRSPAVREGAEAQVKLEKDKGVAPLTPGAASS
jgi:hypothetical protein